MVQKVFPNPCFYLGLTLTILLIFGRAIPSPSFKEDVSLFRRPASAYFSHELFFEARNWSGVRFGVPEPVLISGNSLRESASPSLVLSRTLAALDNEPAGRQEIIEYSVREGDTLSGIAEKFGISLETVLWANDLTSSSQIRPNQKLTILPTSGVMHIIVEGDTVSELATYYAASSTKIIAFNELSEAGEVFIGDILVIPAGKLPKKTPRAIRPLASSYFICPLASPCRKTQGLHWYNAVDLSNNVCAEPVFAAAGGKIQKTGYDRLAGYFIRILHPNEVVTFYGHLSKILRAVGQAVSQGETIGYSGYSGYTIPAGPAGCHVHFEVRGASNPFGY